MSSATILHAPAGAQIDTGATRQVPTYRYNCVSGADLLSVKVEAGVATEIGPHFNGRGLYPGNGKPCVKAYGLIQKTYHPDRILTPMKRSNPNKGWIRTLASYRFRGTRRSTSSPPSSTTSARAVCSTTRSCPASH